MHIRRTVRTYSGTKRWTISLAKKMKNSGGKRICCFFDEEFDAIGLRFRGRNPSRLYGRAQKLSDRKAACTFPKVLRSERMQEGEGPSQGVIEQSQPHERSPLLPKFEDRSQESSLQQERHARRDAWDKAQNVQKFKEKETAIFFWPSDVWSPLAPSSMKPEERGFMADSRASMQMVSRKDLE